MRGHLSRKGNRERGGKGLTSSGDSFNLIITGVGGQGNVLSSQLIGMDEGLLARWRAPV
jgi:hypothetical protein